MKKIVPAKPFDFAFDPQTSALIIIDMQHDFLDSNGFGAALGNDVSLLRSAIIPCQNVLAAARDNDLLVIHTKEGHRADLHDCYEAKLTRGGKKFIGELGPMGRILIRGERGHDIIPELYPRLGEVVIDKPGKGAFYATDLELILKNRGIKTLFFAGVTTEVCVNTTMREANDRGYDSLILTDCCGSYFPEFHKVAIEMLIAQNGIIACAASSNEFIQALCSDH